MKFRNRKKWRIIQTYIIGWTLAFIFLSVVRGVGTKEVGSLRFSFLHSLAVSVVFGFIFGGISGYGQVLTEERIYKLISLQKLLLIRLLFAVLFLTLIVVVSHAMVTLIFGMRTPLVDFVLEPGSLAIYFFILTVDFLMVVWRQVTLMLGEKNIKRLLLGKFYTPREEERIFMFLDLQSSTQLAEKLGHIKYSMLIQDCFNDLGVVAENEAEIYQYVGDEVILTWTLEDGLRNQNCLNAYFNFKNQLASKQEYYDQKYECFPFFKAGMNAGIVTVTEVGKHKKEIAYHGDTINTAARIQGQCNYYKEEFLVSSYLKTLLDKSGVEFAELDNALLKGKENEVLVYAISKA